LRKRREIVIICILSQLLVCIPVNVLVESNQLQQVAGSTSTITEIAQYDDNFGQFTGLNVTNEIVAISTNTGVLFLNQSQEILEGEKMFPNIGTRDVAIDGDIAYFVDFNGTTALDISDLSNITKLDTFRHESWWKRNLEIVNNCAYYINNGNDIVILNISKPNDIQLSSVYQNTEYIKSFKVKQNFIYGTSEEDFFVVNITNISIPEKIDSFSYGEDGISSFVLEDEFAYLQFYNLDNIVVLNLSNPSDVTFYKEIPFQGNNRGFILKDEMGYFVRDDSTPYDPTPKIGIEIYNFSDLNSVFSLSNFTSDSMNLNEITEMLLFENELFLTSLYSIDVINCENKTNIKISGSFNSGGFSRDVFVKDNIVLVADERDGLEVIDIENISKPRKLLQSNHTYCSQIAMYQNFGFILYDNGYAIGVIQITENNEILNLGHIELFIPIYSMDLAFPYLYTTSYWGLSVFYIGSLENPVKVGEYFDFATYTDIKIIDNRAYVIVEEEETNLLKIFTVGTPNNPSLVTSHEINTIGCLEVFDDFAFIGVSGGVEILDVSVPANIRTMSTFVGEESQTPLALHCTGNYLCIYSNYGITILDISIKKEPTEVARFFDGGYTYGSTIEHGRIAFGITSKDNYIFMADGYDNLEILETSFSLTDSPGSKILVYILVPIGAVGVITTGIVVVIKIRKTRKMEI